VKSRRYRSQVVRLHGGPKHGKIVQLTQSSLKMGRYLVPVPVDLLDPDPSPEMPVVTYRRHVLAWYDDVDDTLHYFDYWLAEGAKLPELHVLGTIST
jgi:hypothetical protein